MGVVLRLAISSPQICPSLCTHCGAALHVGYKSLLTKAKQSVISIIFTSTKVY